MSSLIIPWPKTNRWCSGPRNIRSARRGDNPSRGRPIASPTAIPSSTPQRRSVRGVSFVALACICNDMSTAGPRGTPSRFATVAGCHGVMRLQCSRPHTRKDLMPGSIPTSRSDRNTSPSRHCAGCMGLAGTWNPAEVGPEHRRCAIAAFEAALEAGITFYDHADIYGGTACESIFKDCLAAVPGAASASSSRRSSASATATTTTRPTHIRDSIRGSLDRMGIDYVDLYQVHRPDPLADPRETAEVARRLVEELVAIRRVVTTTRTRRSPCADLHAPIVSNQITISLLRLDPIYEGHAGDRIPKAARRRRARPVPGAGPSRRSPTAPSAPAGSPGRKPPPADHPHARADRRTLAALREMGQGVRRRNRRRTRDRVAPAPSRRIIPIVGSNNPEHIHEAAGALKIELSRTDWYKLWVAARGDEVP